MLRLVRLLSVALFALLAVTSFQAASAQTMHYALDVTIETEDGSPIPAGTVCIDSVTGGQTCMDIPDGSPSGRDFYFEGLPSGEHTVTVNAGDYLEAIAYGNAEDPAGSVTIVLQHEVTPPSNLPNTGAGVTADANGSLAMVLAGTASVLMLGAAGAYVSRRPVR